MQARRNILKVLKNKTVNQEYLSTKTVHQKWEVDTFLDKEMLKELTSPLGQSYKNAKVNPSNWNEKTHKTVTQKHMWKYKAHY